MVRVKICGLTKKEHIQVAVEEQVDYIGFVFAKSKRQVTVEQAKVLAQSIPEPIQKVGVFVNETVENMLHIAKEVPLDVIQLHGQETQQVVEALKPYTTIKAISVRTKEDVQKAAQYNVDYYLFDAPGIEYEGGSGNTFDWTLLENTKINRQNIILAGGLTPENVGRAIEQVEPYGIDVSSGVEIDGQKDEMRMRAFMNQTRNGVV